MRRREFQPNDEYYTRREDIEAQLPEFDLRDKIVYCCADTDESEFVKYFKQPGRCKELLYTSDDFNTHEDLFRRCDIVVTNPPFSRKIDLRKILEKYKKDFILIFPTLPHFPPPRRDVETLFFQKVKKFSNTDKQVSCQWVSNIGTKKHPYGYSFQELFGKPIPTTEKKGDSSSPLCKRLLRKGIQVYKYTKKSGFPKNDELFLVSSDNNFSEILLIWPMNAGGSLVKWRKEVRK